jgi:outer membrane usher protein
MWKRVSAYLNARVKTRRPGSAASPFNWARALIPTLTLALALCLSAVTAHAEQLIVRIILNQEDKGDLFVSREADGDFLLKSDDLKGIGFRAPVGKATVLEGESYRSLRSMDGVSYSFDEGQLALALTAPPSLLGTATVDFSAPQAQKVYYPADTSVFLNYGADYLAGSSFSSSNLNLTNQLGARTGNLLFLTDSVYSKDQTQGRFVRLQSSLTHDDRDTLQRFIAGDFFASSGELGSSLNMGGLSFSKIFRIDPYFISYPTLGLAGQVALPSEAKIYLNGILMRTERFSPGEFQLKNITPYGSSGNVEVVLKDSFGRERRLDYPFYFGGASLLKPGLQEYSYNLGFLRDQYGSESNRYSDLAFSGFHRFGVSDALTLGFRSEASSGLYNLGPQATILLDHAGLLGLTLAGSTGDRSRTGAAGTVSYTYQGLNAGVTLSLASYTRDYAVVAGSPAFVPKSQAVASVSYSDKRLGSLSAGYSSTRMYLGQDTDVASLGYSRNLYSNLSFTASYRNIKQTEYSNEVFVSLNYSPKPDLSVSASYQSANGSRNSVLEVQKNAPIGEGYGYRMVLDHSSAAGQSTTTANPSVQYNGRYGIYQAEINAQEGSGNSTQQYHLATSGALVYVGHTFAATRPVYDSFGLVKVGNLEGIKVLLNSQEIGTTDAAGKLIVPDLGAFYQNQVAIDSKQIPIEYFLSSVVKVISPPLRSGSCLPFIAKKLQPISGSLLVRSGGVLKPVEFQEVTLTIMGKDIVVPTGTGGIFDIDLSQSEEFKKLSEAEESGCGSFVEGSSLFIKPGTYQGRVDYLEKPRSFALTIPETTDPVIDLGQIIIDIPSGAPTPASAPPVPNVAPKPAPPPAPAPAAKPIQVPAPKPVQPPAAKPVQAPLESPAPAAKPLPEDLPIMEVNFRFGTTELASSDDEAILSTAVRLMELFPEARVVIEGYTDQLGTSQYNDLLSKKRALAVAASLKKLGVPARRIAKVIWFGKNPLKCDNIEESCREQNRRVVIQLVPGP